MHKCTLGSTFVLLTRRQKTSFRIFMLYESVRERGKTKLPVEWQGKFRVAAIQGDSHTPSVCISALGVNSKPEGTGLENEY